MQFNPHLTLSRFIGRREGRRVPGRVPQESLFCELGPVLDLSPGGMRVLSTRPHEGEVSVCLGGMDIDLKLQARVAWIRRLGFRRHEVGLTFLDVDEDVAKILTRIATAHRTRHAI
ncbi:MAG: PilZ domain-containing protein [Planctomycetota bacterium]